MLKKILVFSASVIISLSAYEWTFANAAVLSNDKCVSIANFSDTLKHKEELKMAINLAKNQVEDRSTKDVETPISENTNSTDTYNNEEEIINTDSNEATNSNESAYKAVYTMEATAYTGGECTASGIPPVRDPNGLSTIAVDPSIIPLGSKVYIPGYGEAIAADTGGAINGNIVDLYLNSHNECIQWGRQNVDVYVLAYPGEW